MLFGSQEFWVALLTVLGVALATFIPEVKDTIMEVIPLLAVIIVALVAKATVVQVMAFKYGYTRDEKGAWFN